nr:integrase, catalytic region, zinc finger, CCHC-type, peptidase aspartic, catalytic [Tanacetum cinerariifolium]
MSEIRTADQNPNGNGNLVAARAEGNETGHNGNQMRCYNCRGLGHLARNCTVRPRRRDDAYLQTQLLIAQKEEARIQPQAEEFDLKDASADLDEIEKVNANCILMANLQQASTSGTQTDKAFVYDSDGSAESLYNGKVLIEKHDPLVVHDSEETLQLAQESRLKMKQLNKEIKPANYTKINHLSGVFVSQMAKLHEELYFSNTSKTANVSKPISIPNEEFSNDSTPSVVRKFLNEVKSTIMTLPRVVKHRMTLDTHNWSSSAHQELHKIVKDEIFPIVNQVDARVQNFEIQFLKEASKFVRDFMSLAKEADEFLAKHKALELEIERLLRAVKLENENVELEFQVLNYTKESAHLKTTYKNLFDSVSVTRTQTKTIIDSLQNELHDTIYENAKLRVQLFDKVPEQKDTTRGTSANTKFAKHLIMGKPPSSSKNQTVIQICLWCIDSGCSKHMTENLKLIINFFGKFLGTVRFENDYITAILGFSDLQWGNILITRVYFVEGLGHNLFSVGQFCDSDLEVAFRRNACFARNLKGVDLLSGNRTTNLYTINLHEMASASPICLMARASSTKP